MSQILSQNKRKSTREDNNLSFITAKSETHISSEKGIIFAQQSNMIGGNLEKYQNESLFNRELLKNSTEDREFLDINQTHENNIIARQNSQQYLETYIDSLIEGKKNALSQIDSSTQKVFQYERNMGSSHLDQSNKSQSKQLQQYLLVFK